MRSKHDPRDSLADIIDNIERIEQYLAGLERAAFEQDGRTRDAVERCLERICEAAHRLGDQASLLMPSQPWHDIRDMGSWFRHACDRIDLETVWDTIQSHLPGLKADVGRALALLQRRHPDAEPP